MDLGRIVIDTMTDQSILGALASTIAIILIGFFFRKKGVFTADAGKWLAQVVLRVSLPALAFGSFMLDMDGEMLRTGANVLIWGMILYVLMIVVTPLIYRSYPKDTAVTLQIITIFGSTAFFGIPIAAAIYGPAGVIYATLFNVANAIFLYSYGYLRMSGKSLEGGVLGALKTIFVNPIMIAALLGLLIWVFQGMMPQVTVTDAAGATREVGFLRIDQTAPALFRPVSFLMGLASPLAWLSIGITLGGIPFASAMRNRTSWIYSIIKVVVLPIAVAALLTVTSAVGLLPIDPIAFGLIIIMMITPTATVAASYAISFDKDAELASNGSFLSTLLAVVLLPIWVIVINVIGQLPMFT